MPAGLIGLGLMGTPIAQRVLGHGHPLWVWNRTPAKALDLVSAGAHLASSAEEVFEQCNPVLLCLRNSAAIAAVLGLPDGAARVPLRGRQVVNLGTIAPEDSQALAQAVAAYGGQYIEAPVSGSREPARRGALVGMVAGAPTLHAELDRLLHSFCRSVIHCGPVPAALRMKLCVNHYLIGSVAVLAETLRMAVTCTMDMTVLTQILNEGPMASAVSMRKLEQWQRGDLSAEAAIDDVVDIAGLIQSMARQFQAHTPLLDQAQVIYAQAQQSGWGQADMMAIASTTGPPA